MDINRDYYLDQLVRRKHNGLVKVVTGLRRAGKELPFVQSLQAALA